MPGHQLVVASQNGTSGILEPRSWPGPARGICLPQLRKNGAGSPLQTELVVLLRTTPQDNSCTSGEALTTGTQPQELHVGLVQLYVLVPNRCFRPRKLAADTECARTSPTTPAC